MSLQHMSFGYYYEDTFNRAVWDRLFAECACYVGPAGHINPNNYFDKTAVSKKRQSWWRDTFVSFIGRRERRTKTKWGKKKSQIATNNTLRGQEMWIFHRKVRLIQLTSWKGSCLSCWELKLKVSSDITAPTDLGQLNCTSLYLGRRHRQGAWDQEE